MHDAQEYAKDAIKTLKVSEVSPFDILKDLSDMNKLDICRGSFTSWEVLELMIMVDYFLQDQNPTQKRKK